MFPFCTNLSSISFPKSATSIASSQCWGCNSLVSITVDKDNPVYHSENNCIIETESGALVAGCKSSVIPDGVTSICDSAFYGCEELEMINIPDSVTKIDDYAFCDCFSLKSIDIPDSVTSLGLSVFWDCESLQSVKLGSGITAIDDNVFRGCKLIESIEIPRGVTLIGYSAFKNCEKLKSVVIPDTVKEIKTWAFESCHELTDVSIPASVESIGKSAFFECSSLSHVTISDGVKSIGNYAFEQCENLDSVLIPASVEEIGECAFGYSWNKAADLDVKREDFVIYGFAGTVADEYSRENGFEFHIYLEPFAENLFTGKTQEGKPISYSFNEKTEAKMRRLMAECDEALENGSSADILIDKYIELDDCYYDGMDAEELELLRYYLYGDIEYLDKATHYYDFLIECEQWIYSFLDKIIESPIKNSFFYGMTDEEIDEYVGKGKSDGFYYYKTIMNGILYDYGQIDWTDPENYDLIEEYYVEFVDAANKMAQSEGYANYLGYAYEVENGRSYKVEDTDRFFENVKKYVIPYWQEINKKYENDYNSLSEEDRKTVDSFLDDDGFGEYFDMFYEYKKAVGGTFERAFDNLWRKNGMFYISYDNEGYGAYQYAVPTTGAPYVFFGVGYHEILTIVHEFGHYYEAYRGWQTSEGDLCETQSQANELLFLRFVENSGFFSDEVMNVIKENKIEEFLSHIVTAALINELEKKAYYDDEFTLGEADAYVESILDETGLDGDPFDLRDYWHYVVIDRAGYYINYATSLIGALNLYKISEDDFEAAVDAYIKLVDYQNNGVECNLSVVYSYAGLYNIFTEEAFKYIFE